MQFKMVINEPIFLVKWDFTARVLMLSVSRAQKTVKTQRILQNESSKGIIKVNTIFLSILLCL